MDGATEVVIMVKQERWFGASGLKLEWAEDHQRQDINPLQAQDKR